MSEQNGRELLEGIVREAEELIRETRQNRKEVQELEAQLDKLYAQGHMTRLYFDLHKERARRIYKKVDYCIKKLEHHRKLALWKLRELSK